MYRHDPQEDEEGMVIANKDFELSDEAKVAFTQNTTLVMEDNNYGNDIYLQVQEFNARIIKEQP